MQANIVSSLAGSIIAVSDVADVDERQQQVPGSGSIIRISIVKPVYSGIGWLLVFWTVI